MRPSIMTTCRSFFRLVHRGPLWPLWFQCGGRRICPDSLSSMLAPDGLVDFVAMDRHLAGRLDPQSHLVAANVDHRHNDLVADHDAFVALPRQDQHGLTFHQSVFEKDLQPTRREGEFAFQTRSQRSTVPTVPVAPSPTNRPGRNTAARTNSSPARQSGGRRSIDDARLASPTK